MIIKFDWVYGNFGETLQLFGKCNSDGRLSLNIGVFGGLVSIERVVGIVDLVRLLYLYGSLFN